MTNEREWLGEQFEQHRPHLNAVAYRMLGSASEAEDAVQEAWLRLARSGAGGLENLPGWLTTVVGRVCLDMLRARRSRRESPLEDELQMPIVSLEGSDDPEQEALLADSVGLALQVVLDTLTPPERLAFVLHDMFGVSFEEIATILERSPVATRQLASRARRRVRGEAPRMDADLALQRGVVEAFLAAARAGDFEALVEVLHPEVVFRVETGRIVRRARPATRGAERVARELLERGAPRFAGLARPAIVNGGAGLIVPARHGLLSVIAFGLREGRIAEIYLLADPEKLSRVVVRGR